MESSALLMMWQQTEWWRLVLALFCGAAVGYVYLESLRWSISRLSESKHKFRLFGSVALCRIFLFFFVLIMVAQKNIIIILFYVAAFFVTKTIFMLHEKNRFLPQNEKGKTVPTMGYEEYYNDVNTSYERLESIVGDLQWPDGRPVLTKFLRPPTLAISAMGTRAILENGFEYIINGSTSTADYSAPTLEAEIKRIRDGLYYRNTLRKGAIFVMHMTSAAKFTANALDVILTANEKKADNDPTKFKVGLLSDYVDYGYSQAKSAKERPREKRRIKWW